MSTQPVGPINLSGTTAAAVVMSTTPNGTPGLAAEIYDVWAVTQNAYIQVGNPASISSASVISSSSAYPIIGAAAPRQMMIPQGCSIGYASSSSGILCYQKVG